MEEVFRSRLNSLPTALKQQVAGYVLQWGMTPTNRRLGILNEFKKFKVPVQELGTGTNRLIIRYQGQAVKIALDNEGIDDNRQEWVMSDRLGPDEKVPASKELSGKRIPLPDGSKKIVGGHLLVASYAPALSSWGEMMMYQQKIRKILNGWSREFVLGDVGITKKNYANWGLLNGKIVCIDYAYIFPAEMKIFECICGNPNLEIVKDTFSSYKCPKCGRTVSDSELRARISNQKRHELFSRVDGLEMKEEYETHTVEKKYAKKNEIYIPTPYDTDPMQIAKNLSAIYGHYDDGHLIDDEDMEEYDDEY